MSETVIDRSGISEQVASDAPSLSETMRIMDVASALRRQRQRAEQELAADEIRLQLRQQLLQAARVTGEQISEQEVEAAIDHYFDNLHTFHEPRPGIRLWLARLYICRMKVFTIAAVVVAVGLLVAWIWLR